MLSSFDLTPFLTLPSDMGRAASEGWRRGWSRGRTAPTVGETRGFAALDRAATEIAAPHDD